MTGPGVEVRGARAHFAQLDAFPAEAAKSMRGALGLASEMMVAHWKLRLRGPRGARRLGVISGNLMGSIRSGRVQRDRVKVGTHLPYAAVHEYGLDRTVHVRGHDRRHKSGTVHYVMDHLRQMTMPKRPHLAPAMRSARKPIHMIFAGKVAEAIRLSKKRGTAIRGAQDKLAGWT